jgi:hypothetical protein
LQADRRLATLQVWSFSPWRSQRGEPAAFVRRSFGVVHAKRGLLMARKYSKAASKKVEKTMHERKKGTLRSGSGAKVKSRKQAVAIGLSQARKAGKKVPKKRSAKK